jgi:hypothetical protein
MKRRSERAVYATRRTTAKALASQLRERCAKKLDSILIGGGRAAKFLASLEAGESYIAVGNTYPSEHGEWKFEIAEERKTQLGFATTNWSCDVHVTPELDVFIKETTSPVPGYVAACIERSVS